jgi:hypothetical protein
VEGRAAPLAAFPAAAAGLGFLFGCVVFFHFLLFIFFHVEEKMDS